MSFGESVSTVFSKYATFSGRARRSEYWWWQLFYFLVLLVATILDNVIGWKVVNTATSTGWLTVLLALALALPTIAVTFRRLHDTGRSGWWWLLTLVCGIGGIIVFIFCVMDSRPDNEYGPNPKGGGLATT